MSLSNQLQRGKIGEHLVCADLISKGYSAYLSEQGLGYDVVLDANNRLYRIQVKSTEKARINDKRNKNNWEVYRFQVRSGRGAKKRVKLESCDLLAFVALDSKDIAYLGPDDFKSGDSFPLCVDFHSPAVEYKGRVYSNGKQRAPFGRYINKYPIGRIV